jgi:methionine-rich copper-binding protein CopC
MLTAALGGLALTGALASASPALAHARYKSSTPATGEAITASPARGEITFTQEIQKIAGGYGITVVKDRGLDVTAGPAVVDDADRHKLSVPLQPDLSNGRYVVHWNNTSDEDGDPAEGAFSFYLNYTPNAVDLANDEQLAQIGVEEETPAAAETPGAGATSQATTAASPGATTAPVATAAVITSAPTASATATSSDDGGGDSNRTQWIIAGIAIGVVFVIALGGWRAFGGRR